MKKWYLWLVLSFVFAIAGVINYYDGKAVIAQVIQVSITVILAITQLLCDRKGEKGKRVFRHIAMVLSVVLSIWIVVMIINNVIPSMFAPERGSDKIENSISNNVNTLNDKWGIYLYAEDVTSTGLTLKIEQYGGNPSGSLEYGAAFFLESMVNEEWQPVETVTGEPLAWNALGYMVKMNDITKMDINWEYGYGKLNPGSYRLKKEIIDLRAPGDYDKKTYEVYFTIE